SYGDINSDGKINLLDLVALRKHLAKWSIEIDTAAADCNADGKVNLLDLVLLRKYLAKWSVKLGPQ
ncbi:MAG: dockerin type I repeat-containing protein, partial [Acutalibacteraceae bacterium]